MWAVNVRLDKPKTALYKSGMTKPLSGMAYVRWLHGRVHRRGRIVAMHKQGISLAEIGRTFKISRERVRQIVKGNGA